MTSVYVPIRLSRQGTSLGTACSILPACKKLLFLSQLQ